MHSFLIILITHKQRERKNIPILINAIERRRKHTVTERDKVTKRTPSLDWERQRHRRRNHKLELECYVISMIAELRFVFGENETVRDLRERACDIWETESSFVFLKFFSRVENFRVFLLGVVNLRGFTF